MKTPKETTQNSNNAKKTPESVKRYLTLTFQYTEKENQKSHQGFVSYFLNLILNQVIAYNKIAWQQSVANKYPEMDLFGMYIDPNDMDIEAQNEINVEQKKRVNGTK